MTNTCVCGCGRTLLDGYAATECTENARRQLLGDERRDDKPGIVELVDPARAIAHRQTAADSDIHSPPGPRDLLDYQAGQRLTIVQISLTGWAQQICEERGVNVDPDDQRDVIVKAAEFLAANLEWLRHVSWVNLALTEIRDCLAAMRSIVTAPAGRVYLGACGAEIELCGAGKADDAGIWWYCELRHHHEGDHSFEDHSLEHFRTCTGDVYGKPDKAAAYCQTCGAAYDQAERRVQVARLVKGGCYRASQLEHAYGLNAATVRKWAERELIVARERDGQGRPMYRLDEVLVVAASENERLEQARRKRHQREGAVAGVTPG